jgi:predicted permease
MTTMNIGYLVWAVFRAVIMFVLLAIVGFVLKSMKVLDATTDSVISRLNFRIFLPTYAVIEIGYAIQIDNIADPLTTLLALVLFYLIAFLYGLVLTKITKVDHRFKYCFILVLMFGNFFVLPGMVVEASCKIGGVIYESTKLQGQREICTKQNNGWSYTSIGLLAFGLLWFIATPFIEMDKKAHFKAKRRVRSILHFYPSVAKFMEDPDLKYLVLPANASKEIPPKQDKTNAKDDDTNLLKVKVNLDPKEDVVEVSETLIVDQIHSFRLTDAYEKTLYGQYKKLKLATKAKGVMCSAFRCRPCDKTTTNVNCCYILGLIKTPPVIGAIAGVIIGLLKPQHDWMYNPKGPFIIFVDNFRKLGNIAAPLGCLLLGSKMVGNFRISKTMYIRYLDLIMSLVEKYILFPPLGYAILLLLRKVNPNMNTNLTLNMVCYMHWVSPFSYYILLCFMVYQYGADEISMILFWHHLICSIPISAWLVLWGIMYV